MNHRAQPVEIGRMNLLIPLAGEHVCIMLIGYDKKDFGPS